jgi:hypothetical protein
MVVVVVADRDLVRPAAAPRVVVPGGLVRPAQQARPTGVVVVVVVVAKTPLP